MKDLAKRYGPVEAVRGVSFDVVPGEIFGLLGRNGAGKTTTLECILGLRRPDAGSVTLDGIDAIAEPGRAKQRVGAQLQFAALQNKITPRQALRMFASFYAESVSLDSLLEQFQLVGKADETFDTLSSGQRQRLFLALAHVNRPQLVVLDEPTAGLDPISRREVHRSIARTKSEGRSVLLSTHNLEEAQQLCDRVGILHDGQIVALATPAALIARAKNRSRLVFRTTRLIDAASIRALPGVVDARLYSGGWRLTSTEVNRTTRQLIRELEAGGNELLELQVTPPSLEDVFVELTGRDWKVPTEAETSC